MLGDSFSSITPRLANLSTAGAEMGQKNHSYALPPEVVDTLAKIKEDSVKNLLSNF